MEEQILISKNDYKSILGLLKTIWDFISSCGTNAMIKTVLGMNADLLELNAKQESGDQFLAEYISNIAFRIQLLHEYLYDLEKSYHELNHLEKQNQKL